LPERRRRDRESSANCVDPFGEGGESRLTDVLILRPHCLQLVPELTRREEDCQLDDLAIKVAKTRDGPLKAFAPGVLAGEAGLVTLAPDLQDELYAESESRPGRDAQ